MSDEKRRFLHIPFGVGGKEERPRRAARERCSERQHAFAVTTQLEPQAAPRPALHRLAEVQGAARPRVVEASLRPHHDNAGPAELVGDYGRDEELVAAFTDKREVVPPQRREASTQHREQVADLDPFLRRAARVNQRQAWRFRECAEAPAGDDDVHAFSAHG
jgi:hypothetical protein